MPTYLYECNVVNANLACTIILNFGPWRVILVLYIIAALVPANNGHNLTASHPNAIRACAHEMRARKKNGCAKGDTAEIQRPWQDYDLDVPDA